MTRQRPYLNRQVAALLVLMLVAASAWLGSLESGQIAPVTVELEQQLFGTSRSAIELEKLAVKGRAPKTNYARSQFGDGWQSVQGCSTRQIILARDLVNLTLSEGCNVASGELEDPYTGSHISFKRGPQTSALVQIDHVVALGDAWQKGAQSLTRERRTIFANDPLNLLAVDGAANQAKSDSDAATWLPPNKGFRCQYVARQIAVKRKYALWVTAAEQDAMRSTLSHCQV